MFGLIWILQEVPWKRSRCSEIGRVVWVSVSFGRSDRKLQNVVSTVYGIVYREVEVARAVAEGVERVLVVDRLTRKKRGAISESPFLKVIPKDSCESTHLLISL